MPDYLSPEDSEQLEIATSPSALAILNSSELESMIKVANLPGNRRKLKEFSDKLQEYATFNQQVAISMFFSLPRSNKQIIGPSVRFSEVVVPCWKNCTVASRVVGESGDVITAQGVFHDLENNIKNAVEIPRRIADKDGKRYNIDLINLSGNAAAAIAKRNSVLKGGVPQALWEPSYQQAQICAVGKALSHAQRVSEAMDYLHKLGVTEWQILNSVGVSSVANLELEHIAILRVLCSEIKKGDKTIEEVFGSQYDKEIDAAFLQLKMNQAQITMLRNSYSGRADQLISYLRERLGSSSTKPAPAAKPAPTVTQQETEPVNHLWTDEQVAELKAKGAIIEDTPGGISGEPINKEPFKPDPLPNANAIPYTVDAEGKSVRVPPLETDVIEENLDAEPKEQGPIPSQATPPPIFDEVQPAHRRGRLSNAEKARRAAAAQGNLMAELPASEAEARQQVEDMVEQTDQFAF